MALPKSLLIGRLLGTDVVSSIDNNMVTLEAAIADILGLTLDSNVVTPAFFAVTQTQGALTVPQVRVTLAGDMTTGIAGYEAIRWDTEAYDTDTLWVTGALSDFIVIVRPGKYLVNCHVQLEGNSGGHKIFIKKNSDGPPFAAYSSDDRPGTQWGGLSVTVPMDLAAADTITAYICSPIVTQKVIASGTSFSAVRLGA